MSEAGKLCGVCGQLRPLSEFHKRTTSPDGRAPWCKACVADYDRARYQANREAAVERAKRWTSANRSRRAEISRRWYANNKESAARAVKRWNVENREQSRAIKLVGEQRRRARKLSAYREEWTTTDILERAGWQCQVPKCICPTGRAIDPGAKVRWRGTADHVVPLSRGGDDAPHNLRAAHQACNSSKNRSLDGERYPDQGDPSN